MGCQGDMFVGEVAHPGAYGLIAEVALFDNRGDQQSENTGNYHGPTRQRRIYGNSDETQILNPSLTFRVGMAANAQRQKAPASEGVAKCSLADASGL